MGPFERGRIHGRGEIVAPVEFGVEPGVCADVGGRLREGIGCSGGGVPELALPDEQTARATRLVSFNNETIFRIGERAGGRVLTSDISVTPW
jgi:hypothetical protein